MTIRHRLDGPAIEGADGGGAWIQHNRLHRLDGPAVEFQDGRVQYWIDGALLSAQGFQLKLSMMNTPVAKEMTMAELEETLGHPVKITR